MLILTSHIVTTISFVEKGPYLLLCFRIISKTDGVPSEYKMRIRMPNQPHQYMSSYWIIAETLFLYNSLHEDAVLNIDAVKSFELK